MQAMARHDSESKQNGIKIDPSEAEKEEVTSNQLKLNFMIDL